MLNIRMNLWDKPPAYSYSHINISLCLYPAFQQPFTVHPYSTVIPYSTGILSRCKHMQYGYFIQLYIHTVLVFLTVLVIHTVHKYTVLVSYTVLVIHIVYGYTVLLIHTLYILTTVHLSSTGIPYNCMPIQYGTLIATRADARSYVYAPIAHLCHTFTPFMNGTHRFIVFIWRIGFVFGVNFLTPTQSPICAKCSSCIWWHVTNRCVYMAHRNFFSCQFFDGCSWHCSCYMLIVLPHMVRGRWSYSHNSIVWSLQRRCVQ